MNRGFQDRELLYYILNVALLIGVAAIVFPHRPFDMFWGGEGGQFQLQIAQQHIWMSPGLNIGMQPIMGSGGIFYPYNTTIVPMYAAQFWMLGKVDPVLTYTILAIELFTAVYLLGRSLEFTAWNSSIAGWLVVFLMLPFTAANRLGFPVGYLIPNYPEMVAIASLTLALFSQVGKRGALSFAWRTTSIALIMAWAITALPAVVAIAIPVLTLYGLGLFAISSSKAELLAKLSCVAIGFVVLWAGGFLEFLWSLYAYTAVYVFGSELIGAQPPLMYASILFGSGYSFVPPLLFVSSALGAGIALLFERGAIRRFATVHLAVLALVLLLAILFYKIFPGVLAINILYFEFCAWPMYAIFSIAFFGYVARTVIDVLGILVYQTTFAPPVWFNRHTSQWLGVPAVALVAFLVAARVGAGQDPGFTSSRRSAFTDLLEPVVSAVPGKDFGGRVATFSGVRGRSSVGWSDLDAGEQDEKLHNDHRLIGLWKFAIPTHQQNHQFITPMEYLIASRLLARPEDRQGRNNIAITRPDIPLLRAWGVRYLVVDEPPPGTQRLGSIEWDGGQRKVSLVEISNPNLRGFSPTEVVVAGGAADTLRWMKTEPDYDRQVMLEAPLNATLVRAERSHISYVKGGVRVQAESRGQSLLVLPIEFSHCLSIKSKSDKAVPRLIRADLIFAALMFDGAIDVIVELEVGPLQRRSCRTADVRDVASLDLKSAARSYPVGQ